MVGKTVAQVAVSMTLLFGGLGGRASIRETRQQFQCPSFSTVIKDFLGVVPVSMTPERELEEPGLG